MTIENKLNSIAASKEAIKVAIQEKGVSCDDTLAEYANRIKAIPSPKIQDYKEVSATNDNFDYVSERSTFIPDAGYDAMQRVIMINDVVEYNIGINQGDIPQIASGASFSFNVNEKENLMLLRLFCNKDDDITHAVYSAEIAFKSLDKRFILYEYSADGSAIEKLWLAQYAYNSTNLKLTVTVLQEITITQ